MVSWQVVFAKHAQKDAKKLLAAGLKPKAQELLGVLADNPFQNPPPYEKLVGDLAGTYSRRLNIQHRLVYEAFPKERVVRVLRMWTHYECSGLISIATTPIALSGFYLGLSASVFVLRTPRMQLF